MACHNIDLYLILSLYPWRIIIHNTVKLQRKSIYVHFPCQLHENSNQNAHNFRIHFKVKFDKINLIFAIKEICWILHVTVKSVQLELFTLSVGQLYLKLKYDIANIRLLQIHVVKIHLGYAIMMSIYTSIIITLLCIHSKHRVLTFTRK